MSNQAIAESTLFWTQVAAIGQVLGAFATAAAVIVSLVIVMSQRRIVLDMKVGIRSIFDDTTKVATDLILWEITNTGQREVRLSSVGWRTGLISGRFHRWAPDFLKAQWAVQRLSNDPACGRLPFDLMPGKNIHFFIELGVFENAIKDMRSDFFLRKLPWLDRVIGTRIQGSVSTVGGPTLYASVEKPLANYFRTGQHDGFEAKIAARNNEI
jgi:hypothetical protein